jgi:hypothetical protein
MPENTVLGIEANRFAIRAVLSGIANDTLNSIEAKPHEHERIAEFIRYSLRSHPSLRIVGSPLDEWPTGLLALLEQNAPVRWLPPSVMRRTVREAADWYRHRRLLRARFYTWLERRQVDDRYWSPLELVLAWEEHLAVESRALVSAAREKYALY